MVASKEELMSMRHDGTPLFRPGELSAPYTIAEIKSINFLNLISLSICYMSYACTSSIPNNREAEAGRLLKRIVWLRNKNLIGNSKPPTFKLTKFDYFGILHELFPDRDPMESVVVLKVLAKEPKDYEEILKIMESRRFVRK